MDYIEYKLTFSNDADADASEIAVATLADIGFDSFDDSNDYLLCYIEEGQLTKYRVDIAEYVEKLKKEGVDVAINKIETVNWNKEWESNFEPIDIDGICRIRAPFHSKNDAVAHDIIIMPKMSFGTGHHATTYLMIKNIFNLDLKGKKGLDMGSGTGVLSIAALINGAKHMDCVDIDSWAYENCIENCATNGYSSSTSVMLGDATVVVGKEYDFVLANINRNILLADMQHYVVTLHQGGLLQMSGFLEIDIEDIMSKAISLGFSHKKTETKDGWVVMLFMKN
ncbi:MAG: 50S ribosomal protein L11 methyltransferase [Rikenellaceae bacterium]